MCVCVCVRARARARALRACVACVRVNVFVYMCMHKVLMFACVGSCMHVGVCRLHTCASLCT